MSGPSRETFTQGPVYLRTVVKEDMRRASERIAREALEAFVEREVARVVGSAIGDPNPQPSTFPRPRRPANPYRGPS